MDKIVGIGIGHGGSDSGATQNGIIEKVLNLAQGLKLITRLKAHGFTVYADRTTDVYMSLTDRAEYFNNKVPDRELLNFNLHHNSYYASANGSETYRSILNSSSSHVSQFCNLLLGKMEDLGFTNRGNKTRESTKFTGTDYYTIIKKTLSKSVIFEPYFISNTSDIVLGVKHADAIIEAITQSICWYYSVTYIPPKIETVDPYEVHWANESYEYLKKYGIGISDKLYQTPLYRGNAFSMLADLVEIMEKQIIDLNNRIKDLENK